MNSKQIFLNELANLMDKHKVAICSDAADDSSSVGFIFNYNNLENYEILNTKRHHSTPYEIRNISNECNNELVAS